MFNLIIPLRKPIRPLALNNDVHNHVKTLQIDTWPDKKT